MDLPPDRLHLRSTLLAEGFTEAELHRLRRAGFLATVRRGAFVNPEDERLREPAARHALLVQATMPRLAPGAVVSHVSAAVLHGLPVWSVPLRRVHVTRDASAGGRVSGQLHRHVAPLPECEVVDLQGLPVTSLCRTVVDLARTVPFEQAVVIADAASRLADGADLVAAQQRAARRPGGPAAQRVLAFADGRAESVGESRSRVCLWRAGLPDPVPQWEVRSVDDRRVGRVDFGWPQFRTVGEFDGRVKYGRLLRPGQDPGEVVFAEKVREDAIRDQRLGMTRWTWGDLADFAPVAARLRRLIG